MLEESISEGGAEGFLTGSLQIDRGSPSIRCLNVMVTRLPNLCPRSLYNTVSHIVAGIESRQLRYREWSESARTAQNVQISATEIVESSITGLHSPDS